MSIVDLVLVIAAAALAAKAAPEQIRHLNEEGSAIAAKSRFKLS